MEKKTIGSFIAALRRSNGMTQQELADRLNVSNKTVSKWERDESSPEITLIPVIAEIFGVSSDEILKGERLDAAERSEPRVTNKIEKQTKRIIDSTLMRFKNMTYLSAGLIFAGLVGLFVIAYAAYRPVIGFGVFLIFAAAAVVLLLVSLNTVKTAVLGSDHFEEDASALSDFQTTVYRHVFAVVYGAAASLVLALPFVAVRDPHYINSTITFTAYLEYVPLLLMLCILLYGIFYGLMRRKIMPDSEGLYDPAAMRKLNIIQGVIFLAAFVCVSVITTVLRHSGSESFPGVYAAFGGLGLTILSSLAAVAVTAAGAPRGGRLILVFAGIRNLFYGLSAVMALSGVYSWQTDFGSSGYGYNTRALIIPFFVFITATAAYVLARGFVRKTRK